MATAPNEPQDAPRSDEKGRGSEPAVPDEGGPHDIPDDEVIEQTLPAGSRRGDPARPR